MMIRLLLLALLVAVAIAGPVEQKDGNDGDVMTMLKEMQTEVAGLKAQTKELREDKKYLMQEIQKMQDEKQMNGQTMFLATISVEELPSSDDEVIIWDSAPMNSGGYFSTETGGYTAPANGYYQFSVMKQGDNSVGTFYLLVDEERYAETWFWLYSTGGSGTPSTSTTVTVQLTAGQVVKVQNEGSTIIRGNIDGFMRSWFTGHLLYVV